jgi:hypothetical protein
MAEAWTQERLDAIEHAVWELLGKDLSAADLPALRFTLVQRKRSQGW